MRIRSVFVALIGLLAGLLAVVLWRTPRVTGWHPDGSQIRAGQSIEIALNTVVSESRARNHFQIHPSVPGELSVEDQSLVFKPIEPFEYGQTYTVTITPGLPGANRLTSLRTFRQAYDVKEPELLILRDVGGRTNLWRQDSAGAIIQITNENSGIWDYSPLPNGQDVLVSSFDESGGQDLILVSISGERTVLLDCDNQLCRAGRWRPKGDLIAYERWALDESADASQIWLLDTAEGTTWPVETDLGADGLDITGTAGRFPRWSADGRYLAYYKPDTRVIAVVDMLEKRTTFIPANVESMGEWSPSGHQLAYTEMVLSSAETVLEPEEQETASELEHSGFFAHVVVTDLATALSEDLSDGLEVNDGMPTWRPDGEAVALGRSTGGARQIWILPLGQEEAEPLTEDQFAQHTALSWSPDGRWLAFMRSNVQGSDQSSGVWVIDANGENSLLVQEGAYIPRWLP
jgi:Tol biopolymer transport system component